MPRIISRRRNDAATPLLLQTESAPMRHIAFGASPAALVFALTACSDRSSPVEPGSATAPRVIASAQEPPTEINANFPIENCGFTILVELSGKGKTIELPGDRMIFTSPGLTATLTNPANGKQETINITGALQKTVLENGDTVTVATGRNALLDPTVPGLVGLFLTIGRLSWVVDREGQIVQPLQGPGKQIDLCALLA
jgi:hypothetical protein